MMLVNIRKDDALKAYELYKAGVLRHSRRLFKRYVIEETRLFGLKVRSYEKAKEAYLSNPLNSLTTEDSVYGHRVLLSEESLLRDIELAIKHEINDVIAFEMRHMRALDKYLE